MWHHFWFLDIQLGGLPLRWLCVVVVVAMLPAALAPGLLYSGAMPCGLRCRPACPLPLLCVLVLVIC